MVRIVKLSNRIGYAFNILGFKFPITLGYREGYFTKTGQLCYRNRWFAKHPNSYIRSESCNLSSVCISVNIVRRKIWYKIHDEISLWKNLPDWKWYLKCKYRAWINQ